MRRDVGDKLTFSGGITGEFSDHGVNIGIPELERKGGERVPCERHFSTDRSRLPHILALSYKRALRDKKDLILHPVNVPGYSPTETQAPRFASFNLGIYAAKSFRC